MVIPNYRGFEIEVFRSETQIGEVLRVTVANNQSGHLYYEETCYDDVSIRDKIKKIKELIAEDDES